MENAEANFYTEDGVLYSAGNSQLVCYPRGKSDETYEILQGTKSIEEEAFYSCPNLTKVVVPNSVTTIERMAFYNCTSLENVVLGLSVETIGGSIFF